MLSFIFITNKDTKMSNAYLVIITAFSIFMLGYGIYIIGNSMRVGDLHGKRYDAVVSEVEPGTRHKNTCIITESGTKAIYRGSGNIKLGAKVVIQERENRKGEIERIEAYLEGEDIYYKK